MFLGSATEKALSTLRGQLRVETRELKISESIRLIFFRIGGEAYYFKVV